MGDKQFIAFCLERLGQVVVKQGEPARAAWLWGAAEVLREIMGSPMRPVERPSHEHAVAAARTHLGEERFVASWSEGRTMTPEQALATREPLAQPQETTSEVPLSSEKQVLTRRAIAQQFGGLTERERAVAALIAQGKSNREIADVLVVHYRTVETHVSNILSKLGFTSRAQIAVWATEKGLGK